MTLNKNFDVDVFTANDGVRYLLFKNCDSQGISHAIKQIGSHSPYTEILAGEILARSQGNEIVLDIGANLGSFSIPLAIKFKKLRFESFEVQEPIFHQLCGNIFLNNIFNIKAHNFGLSNTRTNITVNLPNYADDHNVGAFTLLPEVHQHLRGPSNNGLTKIVDLYTIDSFNYEKIALIKIDTEGMELEVIEGAIDTLLKNNYPAIIYEAWDVDWFSDKKIKIETLLKKLGYTTIKFTNENSLAWHSSHGHESLYDLLQTATTHKNWITN